MIDIVVSTLVFFSCTSSLYLMVFVGEKLGIPREKLHGEKLEFSPKAIGLALGGLSLPIVIVIAVEHLFHGGSFARLGFFFSWVWPLVFGTLIGFLLVIFEELVKKLISKKTTLTRLIPNGVSLVEWGKYYFWFLIIVFLNSVAEELVYRTYTLENLGEWIPTWTLVAIVSVAFSLVHFITDKATWSKFFSRFIFGVFLSLIYLETRNIWWLIGIHNGNNILAAAISKASWKMGGVCTVEHDVSPIIDKWGSAATYTVAAIVFVISGLWTEPF